MLELKAARDQSLGGTAAAAAGLRGRRRVSGARGRPSPRSRGPRVWQELGQRADGRGCSSLPHPNVGWTPLLGKWVGRAAPSLPFCVKRNAASGGWP